MVLAAFLIALLSSSPGAAALPAPDRALALYGHGLWAPGGAERLYQRYSWLTLGLSWELPWLSRLSLGLEARGGEFHEPTRGALVGLGPSLELRLRPWLFVEGGGGTLWTDFAGLASRLNFDVFAGTAVSLPLSGSWSLRAGYRFHHVSNGGTRMPNPGLNGHVPYLGAVFSP